MNELGLDLRQEFAGAIADNLMFDLSAVSVATTHRASTSHPVRRGDRHPSVFCS